MRDSQYTMDYLRGNQSRGLGKGLTIGTFLAYRLEGKAKKYGAGYHRALLNSMLRLVAQGRAEKGISAGKATAYYPHGWSKDAA